MTKTPLQSTTIQGGIVNIVTGLSLIIGFDLDASYLTELVQAGGLLAGGIMVFYGRWKATGKISLTK